MHALWQPSGPIRDNLSNKFQRRQGFGGWGDDKNLVSSALSRTTDTKGRGNETAKMAIAIFDNNGSIKTNIIIASRSDGYLSHEKLDLLLQETIQLDSSICLWCTHSVARKFSLACNNHHRSFARPKLHAFSMKHELVAQFAH